jgi:UDP-MurNAc hydroxylase
MKVTSIGHAGLKVETDNGYYLMDPWFSPYGNFQASWFQYPDNSDVLNDESIYKPKAIIISHEHLDHCDPWFLSKVDTDVPVVIPKYPSPVLKEKILLGGKRQIIEVPEWEVFKLSKNDSLFFVSEPPMNHDSAIVLTSGGFSLLNMNDARLFPMQLRDIKSKVGGKIDVFGFQGAGASWFPMVYDFEKKLNDKYRKQKRKSKLRYTLKIMKIVEPIMGMPFAGPPCFLDQELFKYNSEMEEGIFPDQSQVSDFLIKKGFKNVEILLPNDTWDTQSRCKTTTKAMENFSFENRQEYLLNYYQRKLPFIKEVYDSNPEPLKSLWDDFKSYMENLLTLNEYFNNKIDMKVGFEIEGIGGGDWFVDFRKGKESVGEGLEECAYIYTLESRWLPKILNGSVPWEDFFLSLRFSARRNPDRYNDHLLGLLKFADREALAEVEKFETNPKSEEMMTVHSEGVSYSISRFCPHAGNDMLETGEVIPGGFFRCLAHHYDFDLKTGECITGTCSAIKVERLD